MLEGFVFIGVIIGLIEGFKLMMKLDPELGEASVVMVPVGGFFGGLLFYGAGLIIGAIAWFITTFWLPIIGVSAFVASAIYAATHPSEMKMLSLHINRLFSTAVSHIRMSDRVIMRYATKQTKKLIAIAPEFEWLDIRTSVSELGTRHIAQLLHERKSLRGAIKHVRKVLKQVAWQKEDREDFEKANARRSAQNIESLVVKLQKNEKDIAEALDMLRHLEADLAVATTEEYKRDEIKAKLQTLVSRIQVNSADVQDARTESDDYAQGRIRRLTE